ncbi:hypothetical protein CERSUDRAFT_156445 [Gelatoporia subvermispora B]|uniref:Cyclin N-terminal domain-containing protein n=1 Tax=Ceriporiopsis subvermispora (strain B) TaxID=914234 RepID=M2QUI0_CERS8|nr:hypothetical protein CERSUDRAFT_156445 [Gelatoporia subvermispora B]
MTETTDSTSRDDGREFRLIVTPRCFETPVSSYHQTAPLDHRSDHFTVKDGPRVGIVPSSTRVLNSTAPSGQSNSKPIPKQVQQEWLPSSESPANVEGKPHVDCYYEEIRAYMAERERTTMPSVGMISSQPEFRWHMRRGLVEFMMRCHRTVFRDSEEILFLAMNIVDRYMSRRVVYVDHTQLLACTALWIAAKYVEDHRVATVSALAYASTDHRFKDCATEFEAHVLLTLEWDLGHPSTVAWLNMLCEVTDEDKIRHVAQFLLRYALFFRDFLKYLPSSLAMGALVLARHICGGHIKQTVEIPDYLDIVELFDNRLSQDIYSIPSVLKEKYNGLPWSEGSVSVQEYYLKGGHFSQHAKTEAAEHGDHAVHPINSSRAHTESESFEDPSISQSTQMMTDEVVQSFVSTELDVPDTSHYS